MHKSVRGRRRIRSPPAHGANDKHQTTYPSFKRGGIGGARSLPPPVADFTSSVRLAPATFPRGEGSGSVLRVRISKQSRPAQESSAPEACGTVQICDLGNSSHARAARESKLKAPLERLQLTAPKTASAGKTHPPIMIRPSGVYGGAHPEPRGDERPRCGIKRIGSGLNRRNFRTISVREARSRAPAVREKARRKRGEPQSTESPLSGRQWRT